MNFGHSHEGCCYFFLIFLGSSLLIAQQGGIIYNPLEHGSFSGNNKTGIWEYYDRPAKLSLKVDYDNGKLIYVAPDTSHFTIEHQGKWVKAKLSVPCHYLGSTTALAEHYRRSFAFPAKLLEKGQSFITWLTFEVSEKGVVWCTPKIGQVC